MDNRNNLNLGDKVINLVQNALKDEDFKRLNHDVQNIAKEALDEARKAIGLNNWTNIDNKKKTSNNKTKESDYPKSKNITSTIIETKPTKIKSKDNNLELKPKRALNQKDYIVPRGQVSSVLLSVFGGIGIGAFGIAIFVLTLLGNLMGSFFSTIAAFLLPMFFLSVGASIKGNINRKRLKRFQKYVLYMADKGYILISDLAYATGLSKKYIEKDLRKMISSGMFPQGHLDNKKTTFILTNDLYKQYQKIQYLEVEKSLASEKSKEIEVKTEERPSLSPQVKKTLDEGRKLVLEIREANDEIPGEEISNKLDRLEEVTGKIFNYVEVHPEKCDEIRKFTDYFLPTTLKLLAAYRKLDDQPVQGQNIRSSKEEIEKTMDTINIAFENLLDDLFQDMAMDISTDISVLETMFAQEGLTHSQMRINDKTREEKEWTKKSQN